MAGKRKPSGPAPTDPPVWLLEPDIHSWAGSTPVEGDPWPGAMRRVHAGNAVGAARRQWEKATGRRIFGVYPYRLPSRDGLPRPADWLEQITEAK